MFLKSFTAPIDELEVIYRNRREERFNANVPIKGYGVRRIFNHLIQIILVLDGLFAKERIVTIKDKHTKTNKPIIYFSTHIGGNDIQRCLQVIGKQAYMFLGDPRDLYKNINGLFLYVNGCIMFDTEYKTDRKIAFHRAIEVLKNGQNLLIYPEGVWNVTPSTLVLQLFLGAVRMAKETGAEIVPMAVEQYGNTFYFNIGENIDLTKLNIIDEIEINNYLRDTLASLKYEIFEKHPAERTDFPPDYWDKFLKNKFDSFDYDYGIDDIERSYYIPKGVVSAKEAFAHLNALKPNKNNAFLFDKRLKG